MQKFLTILIIALLYMGLTSCGHKGPPKPPKLDNKITNS